MTEPSPDDKLRALLHSSTEVPQMPGAARQRVRARLDNIFEVTGPVSSPGHTANPSISTKTVPAGVVGALGGMAIGIAIGWGLASYQLSRTHESAASEETAVLSAPVTIPDAAPVAPQPTAEHEEPSESARASTSKRQPSIRRPQRSKDPGGTLVAERRLIEAALGALQKGNADEALRVLNRHEKRFPKGILAQEREKLRARALRHRNESSSP